MPTSSYYRSILICRPRHEVIKLTPKGYLFRKQLHTSPAALITWFKRHWSDPYV